MLEVVNGQVSYLGRTWEVRRYKPSESFTFISHGENWELSNFYPCRLQYNGLDFQSSEQLFNWLRFQGNKGGKRLTPEDILNGILSKRGLDNGRWVKAYCMSKEGYIAESINQVECLKTAIETKYRCSGEFRERLKLSGDKWIVEDARGHGDNFWGCVYNSEIGLYEGVNVCGRLLMGVRRRHNGGFNQTQTDI